MRLVLWFALCALFALCACGRDGFGSGGPDAADFDVTFGDGSGSDGGGPVGTNDCTTVTYLGYGQPGADGVWFTADDVADTRETAEFDGHGVLLREYEYNSAGPDGVWGTADDVIQSLDVYDQGADGPTARRSYMGAGADQTWGTADDEPGIFERYTYDAAGHLTWTLAADAAGPDGVWGTSDDHVMTASSFTDYVGKRPTNIFYRGAPGPDGAWGTSDDVVDGRTSWELAADDVTVLTATDYGSPGPDGAWGTSDDVVRAVSRYDCANQRIDQSNVGPQFTEVKSYLALVVDPAGCFDVCRSAPIVN